jgi:2-keto-4-pentenoate hydratase/2-oxohepta-3-ene-1,7-dioic acid hydratase in catechol pathway
MGPWITPSAYVTDPGNLAVRLWVNDTLKQRSNTSQLIHSIPEQVSWLSRQLTLLPGDVVATGTPSGVGMSNGAYLRQGDRVRIEIQPCGELVTHIV